MSAGGRHSLMLSEGGELYSCGSNDFGQLGREGSQTRLQQVKSKIFTAFVLFRGIYCQLITKVI